MAARRALSRLLWVDLEMSGLDVGTCRILEVAAIVTDLELHELETLCAVVHQPPEVLEAMDTWCKTHHKKSGLTAAVAAGLPEADVESALVSLIARHWPRKHDEVILCGNSIATDRAFIDKYLPRVAKRLHYRMIDVSSWKVILRERFGVAFKKSGKHRALGDVRESIAELGHYLSLLDTTKLGRPG